MAADQVKLRKRLEALLKLPENQACCDCGRRGPRWASANLGNFFCIECSGIHRNLGVHISFVRSVNLDSWTEKQVQFMEQWGNARANEYYEGNLPKHVVKPNQHDPVKVVERFIRDKYEHKKYIANSIPPQREHSNGHTHDAHHSHSHSRSTAHHAPQTAPQSQPTAAPRSQPAAVAAPAPVSKPVPAPELNLLDFDVPVSQPQTVFGFAPAAAGPSAVPAPQAGGHDGFGDFASHNFGAPQHNGNPAAAAQDPFGFQQDAFNGHHQQAAPAPAPPKPHASSDAILSLYNTQGNPGMMGMAPLHMGGAPGHHGYPPQMMMGGHQQHHQQQQFYGQPQHGGYPPAQYGGYPPQQQQYHPGMAPQGGYQHQQFPGAMGGGQGMHGQYPGQYPPQMPVQQGPGGWQQGPPPGAQQWQQQMPMQRF